MKTFVIAFVLALGASFVGTPDAEAVPACKPGYEKSGALCYPKCRAGYYGVGPVCWQRCAAGFSDDGLTCRKNPDIRRKPSYGRGVGRPLSSCSRGYERNGALCYPRCRGGFKGVGPVCWQRCPRGYPDHGAFCGKPRPYGRGGGYVIWDGGKCKRRHRQGCEKWGAMWYPKCRAGFHPAGCCICSPNCVAGMRDIGVSCAKKSYGRGTGRPMGCAPGTERNGALCYPRCRSGYKGLGPVCWGRCGAGYKDDGAICRKDAKINWKKSYGRGAGYPLETVKKFFKDVGEKIKQGFTRFGRLLKEKVIDKIKSFGLMLYGKIKAKVSQLISTVIISLTKKIGFNEADIKAIVNPRTGKYDRAKLQKVVIRKLLVQYLQPIIKDKLLALIDKGLELIQKPLDAAVAAVIGGLGSIPFVGGAIAAAVNIAWSFGMKALRSFAASKLSQLATQKLIAPLINKGISALYKLGGPIKRVIDKLLSTSARFFDRWVVFPGSAVAKSIAPRRSAPRSAPRVAPKPRPRLAPKPRPRVAPKPRPRVAPRPAPRPPVRATPARPTVRKPAPRVALPKPIPVPRIPPARRPAVKPVAVRPIPPDVRRPAVKLPVAPARGWHQRPGVCPDGWAKVKFDGRVVHCRKFAGTPGSCGNLARFPRNYNRCGWSRHCKASWKSYGCTAKVSRPPTKKAPIGVVRPPAKLPTPAKKVPTDVIRKVAKPPTPVVSIASVRKRFGSLYRTVAKARRNGLIAARTLMRLAAKANGKKRTQARRAASRFRRALYGAFRLVYSARSRAVRRLRSLAKNAAGNAAAALARVGAVKVTGSASGAAAKAFNRAKAALTAIARTGAPLIGGGIAVWSGRTQQLLRSMANRFQRVIGQAAAALNDLARALR